MNMPAGDPRMNAFHSYAVYRLQTGFAPQMVVSELVQQGMHPKAAKGMVQHICGGPARRRPAANPAQSEARLEGLGMMIGGGVLGLIGIGITVLSYSAAGPGGTYIVTYGLVIAGAIGFFRGLIQMISGQQ